MVKQKIVQQKDNLEKLLRYALGVDPYEFALIPNSEGFFSIKELIAALREEEGWRGLTEGRILEIHNQPGGISPLEIEGNKIRLKPELQKGQFAGPPEKLVKPKLFYFGLKPQTWPHVAREGLMPKPAETSLKLFSNSEKALKVAKRTCPEPVLITVQVRQAEAKGSIFTPLSSEMWKTNELKPEALSGPLLPPKLEQPETQPESKAQPQVHIPRAQPIVHHGKKKGKYQDAPDWKINTKKERRKDKF
jgi:putative RNA 2'-phosphotransferase